jgi:type VI secretion system secreted protein VgrG
MAATEALKLTSPLGDDVLVTGLRGREALSELFSFQITILMENRKPLAFDKLLVQPVTLDMTFVQGKTRHINGIVRSISEGARDATFTEYTLDVCPKLWVLTRTKRSRLFQHQNVPDILKKVLAGIDVKFEIQGTFQPRRYVAQYRESDFAFACRLMEEEGFYYYFQHATGAHKMILANAPGSHVDVPFQPQVPYDVQVGGTRPELRVEQWSKTQHITPGKYTLWDHCFEMPQKTLEASKVIQESVTIGKVTHKLKTGGNDTWEVYDYPGEFAERFDGIDRSGSAKPAELEHLSKDNVRTVGIRMQQETVAAIDIRGTGNCHQFTAGHKFQLKSHHSADDSYVLTSVEHFATGQQFQTGGGGGFRYSNSFSCIPAALPYRPPQVTPKPIVAGVQLGFVVGPKGEKIFCDKYGRIKVQMHWDREGKEDADSSCWLRVSNQWGGPGWGGNFVPHVGQEVIVSYEEGDPDKPVVTGRVYNGEQMPPLGLPGNKTKSVLRDHGDNQIIMEGHGGSQHIIISSPHMNSLVSFGAAPPGTIPGTVDHGAGSGGGAGLDPMLAEAETPETLEATRSTEDVNETSPATSHEVGDPIAVSEIGAPTRDQAIADEHAESGPNCMRAEVGPPVPAAEAGSGSGSGIPWPATWLSREGLNFATGAFWNVFIGQDVQWEVKGSKTEKIIGNKVSWLGGFKTDYIGGYERKHLVGFAHTTILGWKMDIIVGWKTEIIGGRTLSVLKGSKAEIIKGDTYKLHKGKEMKYEPSGKGEKSANILQMYRDLKQVRNKRNEYLKADASMKAAGKNYQKARKIMLESQTILQQKGNSLREEVKADKKLKAAESKAIVSGDAYVKASKIKKKASQVEVTGGTVKLG